jgi:hypothetical protein
MAVIAVVITAAAAWPSCRGADTPVTHMVRDSAGVTEVSFTWESVDGQLLMDPEPEVVLGGDEGPEESPLFGVVDVTWTGTGEVVVAEFSTQQVVVFGEDGRAQRRIGRRGGGPAEFMGIMQVFAHPGDTIGVFDHTRRRYVLFGPDGMVIRETTVPPISRGSRDRLAVMSDGSFILAAINTFAAPADGPGSFRRPSAIVRVASKVDTIAEVLGLEVFQNEQAAGGVLYGATTVVAGAPDGVWIGDTRGSEARLITLAGAEEARVRWTSSKDQAVTGRTRQALWQTLSGAASAAEQAELAALQEIVVFADTMPAFSSLLVGRNGWLWIGGYIGPESDLLDLPWPAQDWRVVDLEQGKVYAVRTPVGLRLFEADSVQVLGVHQDAMGIETIRRYRFTLPTEVQ